MSAYRRHRATAFAPAAILAARLLCVIATTLIPGRAAAMMIDDFSSAGSTAYPPGLVRTTVGTTTVVEPHTLPGVLGGVRELQLQVTSLGAGDSATVGVYAPGTLID